MSKFEDKLKELSEQFMIEVQEIVENYDHLSDSELDAVIVKIDEEIEKLQEMCDECGEEDCKCEKEELGTEEDQEEIADEVGDEEEDDVEEGIKGTNTKLGKMSSQEKQKAKKYKLQNKAKIAKAERKREVANKAKYARIAKKKEALKKQGNDKYTINSDGKKVKKKTRR